MRILLMITTLAISAVATSDAATTAGAADSSYLLRQDFFFTESVFQEAKGHLRRSVSIRYLRSNSNDVNIPLLYRYGTSETWQTHLRIPLVRTDRTDYGVGNIALGSSKIFHGSIESGQILSASAEYRFRRIANFAADVNDSADIKINYFHNIGFLDLHFNLGGRFDFSTATTNSEQALIFAAAASYPYRSTSLSLEVISETGTQLPETSLATSIAWVVYDKAEISLGTGFGLTSKAPDWQVLTSVGWRKF